MLDITDAGKCFSSPINILSESETVEENTVGVSGHPST